MGQSHMHMISGKAELSIKQINLTIVAIMANELNPDKFLDLM